jgi:hypothetical protein
MLYSYHFRRRLARVGCARNKKLKGSAAHSEGRQAKGRMRAVTEGDLR